VCNGVVDCSSDGSDEVDCGESIISRLIITLPGVVRDRQPAGLASRASCLPLISLSNLVKIRVFFFIPFPQASGSAISTRCSVRRAGASR
jgi:hypothetical protein